MQEVYGYVTQLHGFAKILKKLYQHRDPRKQKPIFVLPRYHVHSPKAGRCPPHHSTRQRHPAMAPRPLFQSWSSPSPQPSHTTMAPHYNGTLQWHHVHSAKVGRHPPNHSTRQCHHVHSLKVGHHPPPQPSHTTMAPHYNGTQQWHHVHSTKVGRHPPPNHSTLQWHPTKAPSNGTTSDAPCNGTQQWHHVHSTIAHYNGTLQRHPAMAPRPAPCNGILVPRPMRKSGSSPSPSIGSKNPYSYRYLGNKSW